MPNLEEQAVQENETQETQASQENTHSKRSKHLKERALQSDNEETLIGLDQVFEAKLAAIRTYEQKLITITDPYAKKTLQNMIRQERKELLHLADLTDLVENGSEMGSFTRAKRRINHQVKDKTGRNLTFWLGAAAIRGHSFPHSKGDTASSCIKSYARYYGLNRTGSRIIGRHSGEYRRFG